MKLICQYMFWPVLEIMVISRTKNWSKICQKYRFCPPWNRNYQSGAWILCWDIFNDYIYVLIWLILYINMRACILSYVRVHGDLLGPKHKKYANYDKFGSLNPDFSIWSLNIVQNIFNDYLWSYMNDWNWYFSMRFDLLYRIYDNFQDKKLVKYMSKTQVLPP